MDFHMRILLVSVLFSSFANFSFAAEITVYRWVDENNVVHFSQHQPAHDNYTELTMTEALRPSANGEADSGVVSGDLQANLDDTNSQNLTPAALKKCNEARANVRTLNNFENVQLTDTDGTTRSLSKKEKQQQLEMNQKQVEVYCNGQ